MKRLLVMSLIISGCMNQTIVNNRQNTIEPKSVKIIEYVQSMTGEIMEDSTKNSDYPRLEIDPCWAFHPASFCDSIKTVSINEFVKNDLDGKIAVVFSEQGFNFRPINNDMGGGSRQYPIGSFPFSFFSTRFNGKDSNQIVIDSISDDYSIFLKINSTAHTIGVGDSLVQIDTVYGRNNSVYCWQRIILTQKIINRGMDSLPNQNYIRFF